MTAAGLLIARFLPAAVAFGGPPRPYPIEEETAIIRGSLREMNLADFPGSMKRRN